MLPLVQGGFLRKPTAAKMLHFVAPKMGPLYPVVMYYCLFALVL